MSNRNASATVETTSSRPASSQAMSTLAPANGSTQKAASSVLGRIWSAGQQVITGLGLIALSALGFLFFNPEVADRLKEISPVSQEVESATAPAIGQMSALVPLSSAISQASWKAEALDADAHQKQRVADWLSRRYRVASDALIVMVAESYRTAQALEIDPLLILSVIAIESRFNPFAESPLGAQGLMQVMSKMHLDKFEQLGGVEAALNPMANIYVGSKILKDYLHRGGSVEAGLKLYVGAGAMKSDLGYGAKVIAEYERLKQVAQGKKVPIYATTANAAAKSKAPRETTSARESEAVPAVGLTTPESMGEEVAAL